MGVKELDKLFCGMDDAQFLELLVANQVAEGAQTDLCILQQSVGRQYLLVGVQFSRFVRRLEEGEQFFFGRNTVRCVVLHLLADVVNDLLLDLGGQGVQQLLLALFKWIHNHTRSLCSGETIMTAANPVGKFVSHL